MGRACKHAMVEITNNFGHAEPLRELMTSLKWNTREVHQAIRPHVDKAVALLKEAEEILAKIEADEEEERKAIKASKAKRKGKARETITFDDLKRLQFCNSNKLPGLIEHEGKRKRWVGISWVDEGEPDGTETVVTE